MKCPICGCDEFDAGTSVLEDGEVINWVSCINCEWEDDEIRV